MPASFDYDPLTKQPIDRYNKPELTHATIEFLAGTDYMVRAPQPPTFVFVIDVSYGAIQSGMVATAAQTILESLGSMPNHLNRTQVGFITVDTSVHYYCFDPSLDEPRMIIDADLEDVTTPDAVQSPAPSHLLTNISEGKLMIEQFLGKLNSLFEQTRITSCAMGAALLCAWKLLSPTGGKLMSFLSTMPNIHAGALKNREDPKLLGTPKVKIQNNLFLEKKRLENFL